MNYAITDTRKIKKCPRCRRYKPGRGNKCVCGFDWQEEKPRGKITKIYQSCPYCDAVGDQPSGLCEKHAEVENLGGAIVHWLNMRNGENELDVYRQVDNFIVLILNTLELDDRLQKGWENYRQKNLEKITKLALEIQTPETKQEENV